MKGSSDGSAPGDRSSPLDGCVYSLRFLLSSVASALSLLGSWAFLPPLSVSLLSDVVVPFLEERVVQHRSGLLLLSSSSGLVAVFASPLWLRAPSFSGVVACGLQSSPCFLP